MADPLLKDLNEAQRLAVCTIQGPLLVVAGPGSGKTRVVSHRVAYLLRQGVPPGAIVALTFTNKAARELAARVEQLVPGARVWTSTFHRFCAHLLRCYGERIGLPPRWRIYDTEESQRVLKQVLEEHELTSWGCTAAQVAQRISRAKNRLLGPEALSPPRSPLDEVVAQAYPLYQQRMLHCAALDFDDLLFYAVELLASDEKLRRQLDRRFRYLMVDEYQDTNLAQYELLRLLSQEEPNLAATGDPDQSIYGWRGADIRNILEFEQDFPEAQVIRLELNYRSTGRILRVADALIAHNRQRKPKRLIAHKGLGEPVRLFHFEDEQEEAQAVAHWILAQVQRGRKFRDFAVFFRVNALSRELEHALRLRGIPYQLVNAVEFYQRREVKDVLAYLAVLWNPRDEQALLRIINVPPRGIGPRTLQGLQQAARAHQLSLWEAARRAEKLTTLGTTALRRVKEFVQLLDQLLPLAQGPLAPLIREVLQRSGYRRLYDTENEEDQQRLFNIEELITAAERFDQEHPPGSLGIFLEQTTLVNETDRWDPQGDAVTLMTLHSAKGLEFPAVWVLGLEEGLLPHERSSLESDQVEEERRLLFVGITRAQEQLCLSYTSWRHFRGRTWMAEPSRFVDELPPEELEHWSSHHWQEEGFDAWLERYLEGPVCELPDQKPKRRPRRLLQGLTTAAQLAGETSDQNQGPWEVGRVVMHPEYGLGVISQIHGQGDKQRVRVRFFAGEHRTFVAQKAPLKPL